MINDRGEAYDIKYIIYIYVKSNMQKVGLI